MMGALGRGMDFIGPDSFREAGWEWLIGAMVLIVLASAAAAGPGQAVIGFWQHPENGSQIEIFPCQNGRLCIKIVKIGDSQQLDDKNPEPALRSRPIIGLTIMSGAEHSGDQNWAGRLYNRTDGQYYDGYLAPVGADKLKLTGCAVVVLCRSMIWRRMPRPGPS